VRGPGYGAPLQPGEGGAPLPDEFPEGQGPSMGEADAPGVQWTEGANPRPVAPPFVAPPAPERPQAPAGPPVHYRVPGVFVFVLTVCAMSFGGCAGCGYGFSTGMRASHVCK
jgi:hypothetical protein